MLVAAHTLDENSGSEQVYNGFDCCITHEIFGKFMQKREEAEPAYSFELALQGPILEMMLRGFRVNPAARELGIESTKAELQRLDYIIQTLAHAVWDKGINPNSGHQLKDFFYNHLGIDPIKSWVKGELKYPMDREILEKIEDYFQARPIVNAILSHRDATKTLSVLETEVDADWRMRTSYNIGGTKVARLSSSKSPTGTGCVLPTTQVLTPRGWKAIHTITPGTLIMQWDAASSVLEFKPCGVHKFPFSGQMKRVSGEQIKQTLTPDHRVPYWDSRQIYMHVEAAKEVATLSQAVMPLGGKYCGGEIAMPRYVAMLMADFSREEYQWRGAFSKQRKIERFLSLAAEFSLDYTEQKARPGYRRFAIKNNHDFPKKWGAWILDLTPESAEELLEEARYWDAHDRGSGFIFFTADQEQAEWFATLAHLTGRSATIRREEQNEGSYSNTTMWWVNVKNRKHARVMRKNWGEITYHGDVYCPSVPGTFWLMREDNFISITGNTNLQNITEELRHILIADPGYILCGIDASQSDSRMVGFMCGVLFDDWTYLDACESGDLHTTVARLVWPEYKWTGDLKNDRKLAETSLYRHYTHRDACKRIGHGANFLGKPATLAKGSHVPEPLVRSFLERYFTSFPCIQQLQQWVATELQTKHQLTSIHGRKRDFFDRVSADETLRKGVAFLAAAATADNLDLGMWRMWRHMPEIQLLAQVHDAVYFQFPEELDHNAVVKKAQDYLTTPLFAPNGRKFIVPTDAKLGYNFGNYVSANTEEGTPERNPSGLRKFVVK